jgi:pyruvate,orthophosphate dikinase
MGRNCSAIFNTHDLATGEEKVNGIYADNSEISDIELGYTTAEDGNAMRGMYRMVFPSIVEPMAKLAKIFNHPMTCSIIVNDTNVYFTEVSKTLFPGCVGLKAALDLIKSGCEEQKVINELLTSEVVSASRKQVISKPKSAFCKGLSGGNGAAVGRVSVSNEDCIHRAAKGEAVVLFKHSLTIADIDAVLAATAVVTESGSDFSVSSAIVRTLGIPAAIACEGLSVDVTKGTIEANGLALNIGDEVTVNNGSVYASSVPLSEPQLNADAAEMFTIINKIRKASGKFEVLTSASNQVEIKSALEMGANGVGSFEVEGVFNDNLDTLINIFVDPENKEFQKTFETELTSALSKALEETGDKPFTFTLLSHSINEFLPSQVELTKKIAELRTRKQFQKGFNGDDELKKTEKQLELVKHHSESNPIMGLRGARLAIRYPEVFECQINALVSALSSSQRPESAPAVRLMIPVTTMGSEIKYIKEKLEKLTRGQVIKIGPSFSAPRACLTAAQSKEYASFYVVNVKDLQETTFGMNELDTRHSFLGDYVDWQIVDNSPFDSLDVTGASQLIQATASQADAEHQVGVYGNFIADRNSINKFREFGVGFIVCNPETVPIACLCAAKTQ